MLCMAKYVCTQDEMSSLRNKPRCGRLRTRIKDYQSPHTLKDVQNVSMNRFMITDILITNNIGIFLKIMNHIVNNDLGFT